jgi:hypothetical protein
MRRDLRNQDFLRCVVTHYVVKLKKDIPLFDTRILSYPHSHERRIPQIQPLPFRRQPLSRLLDWFAIRIQLNFLYRQHRTAVNDLHWPRQLLPHHTGAQNIVTIDRPLQCDNQVFYALP